MDSISGCVSLHYRWRRKENGNGKERRLKSEKKESRERGGSIIERRRAECGKKEVGKG